MTENSTLLIGFPGTGKSTYLAALYNYVMSNVKEKRLTQYQLSNDTEYLNRIHREWVGCKIPQRTGQDGQSNRNVILYLEDLEKNQFTLNIPDVEGEVFKNQWELRTWGKDYGTLARTATGLLFFINIENLVNHMLISDMLPLFQDFLTNANGDDKDKEEGKEKEEDNKDSQDEAKTSLTPEEFKLLKQKWVNEKTPSQVRVVEILQFHLDMIKSKYPIPIAFILSAWDKELKLENGPAPKEWLSVNLPLLYQFLESHKEKICYEVIGVSAQGDSYEKQADVEALKNLDEPADRVKVVVDKQPVSNNIAYPINWILEKWKETRS